MNRHLHSPTKLTEFARNFEEQPETLLTKFVNKITNAYNTSYNTVNDVPFSREPTPQSSSSSLHQQNITSEFNPTNNNEYIEEISKTEVSVSSSDKSISTISNDESPELLEKSSNLSTESQEGRTMLNVLKRISNIVASKNSNLRNYKDTDLQRLWMPDEKAKECYDCGQKFTTFRRKHHCRLCGQIFCSKCCNQVVPGQIIMCSGDLKVCTYCSIIVLSYLKSPDIELDLKHDLQALQQDLTNKFHHIQESNENFEPINPSVQRKASVGYQEERFVTTQPTMSLSNADRKNILQQSHSLKSLYEEMKKLLPLQNCGSDLINFLIISQKSSNKIQAIAILNAMLEAGFLVPLVPDSFQRDFDEHLHYKLIRKVDSMTRSGSIQLDVDYETNSVHMSKSLPLDNPTISEFVDDTNDFKLFKSSFDESISFQSLKDLELENSIISKITTKLVKSYCDHEELLLSQMLRNYNLDEQWSKILIPLCARVANQFRHEYFPKDLMDIRSYVKFKKIAGGSRQDSIIVNGVVFSKNVAHKEMLTRIEKPKVLLLQCPIAFERVEGKFVSFEKLLLQERQYLTNVTRRILSFEPDVVLVHKDVAGIAQDMLRSAGVTLVLDVKLSVMKRLSKCLQCDIVTSIESKFRPAKLGVCDVFYTKNFDDGNGSCKTLMFFEMYSNARCCYCLLRGGNSSELSKVKKISPLLVYARFNWRLEMSFLLDEFARPPSPKLLIFDSKEHSPSSDLEDEINGNKLKSSDSISGEISSIREDQYDQTEENQNKRVIEKKSEEKFVTIENVCDFSDPLRAPEITSPKTDTDISVVEFAVETPYDNRFRTALSSTVLSISPYVAFPLPYLETEQGRKCSLRSLFPNELYYSKQLSNNISNNNDRNSLTNDLVSEKSKNIGNVTLHPIHPFLEMQITKPFDDQEIQTLLAEFRAFGGRYPKTNKKFEVLKREESYQKPQKLSEDIIYKDALDLQNHQRLPVLFCSFYYNPKTASSLCAQPYLLDMKFYGQEDIMLGQFLQRYCFKSYICQFCNLPMMDHVRRYVHSMGCVQVQLTADPNQNETDQIFLTSACSKCVNVYTPSVPISEDTKCFSFAKYLELRFHGHAYKIREIQDVSNEKSDQLSKCPHSLHKDYIHYFSNKGIIAKFSYSSIDVWEIGLPPLVIVLKQPKPFDNMLVLEDIKKFSVQGHEIYSKIYEKIAELSTEDDCQMINNLKVELNRDQLTFKQHIEIVQTLLIEKQVNSYDISDSMLRSKRALAESIELWGPRLNDASSQIKSLINKQDFASHIDSGQICTEELKTDIDSPTSDGSKLPSLADSSITENQLGNIESTVNNSDIEQNSPPIIKNKDVFKVKNVLDTPSDKKTIKKMLSQLLPNTGQVNSLPTPMLSNEHLTLPLGAFPILVNDQDLSSIIAYSLISHDYKKSLESLNSPSTVQNEGNSANGSPSMKRKHDNSVEPEDKDGIKAEVTDDKKQNKSNSHIELYYQDLTTQFTSKIYFAKEFDKLRSIVLHPHKINKSVYKDLEISKKLDEQRIAQKTISTESELLRKTSSNNLNNKTIESPREITINQNDIIIDETRLFLARSLSRSIQWEARGGKSGSKFSKTLDDRFVLKEMSQKEVTIFENFAPNYFDYIIKCLKDNNPTLLAKILGVYRVTIKKKDFVQEKYLLVMENLFYDCDIKNKFDLKGSERNRLVDPTNQNGGEIVLLDENLIQMSWSKPLYILSHSKTILKEAINRDSSFLEKNDVMDYSLLVGLDNDNKVLVLGIIDYIRTFTFDKKVESFVKQSLGGQGKLPTVIRPERYKQRFIEAMDRYFLSVPDRWESLSKK